MARLKVGARLSCATSVAGRLIDLAPEFRDGGNDAAGPTLYQIDPSKLETAVLLAQSDLAEAEAEHTEANMALVHA